MEETNDFFNDGFGWKCRQCSRELPPPDDDHLPRVFREGEAESKNPVLADPALAKWTDATRSVLTCPRCGITEAVDRH
jgi:hypothetical protein